MTFPPRGFRAQLLLLILGALVTAQVAAFVLLLDERRLAVRAALGLEAAGRVAHVVQLLESAPAGAEASILRVAASPFARFSLGPAPIATGVEGPGAARLAARLAELLGDDAREIGLRLTPKRDPERAGAGDAPSEVALDARPSTHDTVGRDGEGRGGEGRDTEGRGGEGARPGPASAGVERAGRDPRHWRRGAAGLALSVRLAGGRWLNLETREPRAPPQVASTALVATGLAALLITAAVWVVADRLARPIAALAEGAERLGRGEAVALAPSGPAEIRRATEAFNRMQARLSRLLDERTRMIAALGHDLRSPLTAMRLRLEMVEEGEDRDRLRNLVAEMERMTEATLAYGRGVQGGEGAAPVDLAALTAEAIAESGLRAGAVRLTAPAPVRATVRPTALKRALRNLIDNAVRYGGAAEVEVRRDPRGGAEITVADRGPGIPAAERERAFEPFARLEASRSRETGGAGLGLAIARDVLRAHGGEVMLADRPGGGLIARVTLPAPLGR